MPVLYTLFGIIIYICFVITIGIINFSDNIKNKIMSICSIIFNAFFGYIDTYFIILLYGYFANKPKGNGYEVPSSEAGFNAMLGTITLLVYFVLLLPINFYMKKKGKINTKTYIIINTIATLLGLIIFWVFLDKNTKLI